MLTAMETVMLRLHCVALANQLPRHELPDLDVIIDDASEIFEFVSGASDPLEDELAEPAGPGPFNGPSINDMGVGQDVDSGYEFPDVPDAGIYAAPRGRMPAFANYADDIPNIYAVPPCDFPNCGCVAPGDCPAMNAAAGHKVDYVDTVEFGAPERLDFASAIKRYYAEQAALAKAETLANILGPRFTVTYDEDARSAVEGASPAMVYEVWFGG
jgi:hypothetical protein